MNVAAAQPVYSGNLCWACRPIWLRSPRRRVTWQRPCQQPSPGRRRQGVGPAQAQPQGFAGPSGTQARPQQPQQQQPGGMYGQQAPMYQQQQPGQGQTQALAQAASAAMAAAPASAAAAAAGRGTGPAQMPASVLGQPRPPLPTQHQQVPGVQQQGYHGQQGYRVRPPVSIIVLGTLHLAACPRLSCLSAADWRHRVPRPLSCQLHTGLPRSLLRPFCGIA